MFVVDEGEKISAVYSFLVLSAQQFIEASGHGVANWPERKYHPADQGGPVIGYCVLVGAGRVGHGHHFCHYQDHNSREEDGRPVGHESVDHQGQGFEDDGIADEEGGQEQVVVVDYSQNTVCHLVGFGV